MGLLNEYRSLADFEADQVAGKVDNDLIYFIKDVQSIFARGVYYGLVSDADKAKLDGIAAGANKYVLPTAGSTLGGVKTTSTVTSSSGYTACPIISGVPYYKDTNTTYSTMTAAEATAGTSTSARLITPKVLHDKVGNPITGLSASGTTVTMTYKDGSTATMTTQDTNTDTKNTAGTTEKAATKLFLAGATSQATNPVTYSNQKVYIGTDNCLYSNSTKVSVNGHTHSQYLTTDGASGTYLSKTDAANTYLTKSGAANTYVASTDFDSFADYVSTFYATKTLSDASNAGLMSAADKAKLDGIAAGANKYVLPTAGSTLGGVKTTSTVTSSSGYTACPIISGVPYYRDTNTDTKNTAGSTNTSSKIYLVGATSQSANPVTYSHDTAYVGTDGCLYSNSTKVSVNGHTHSYAGSSSAGGAANSSYSMNYSTNAVSSNYGDKAYFQQVNAQGDFPHTGWFNSIKMLHNNSDGYFTEIATSFTGTDGMWRRSMVAGSQKGWYKVLDESNYKGYMPKVLSFSASKIYGTTGTKYIDHGVFETYFGGYWLGALVDAIVAGEITGLLGDDGNYYQILGANSSSDQLHIRCDIYDAALYRGSYIDMIFTSGSTVTAYVTKY